MESSPNESPKSAATDFPRAISNIRILLCSIGLTLFAAFVLPVQFDKKYRVEIFITATGVRDENVKGREVWVGEAVGRGIVAAATAVGWERRDNLQVSYQFQPATLKWEGAIDPNYRLFFIRHPDSGRMILSINGVSKEYILYSEKDQAPLEIRPFDLMSNPQPMYGETLLTAILTLCGLFILVHGTLLFIIRRAATETTKKNPSHNFYFLLALPSLFIYFITLLAMWPAQMSPDSVTHWVESETRNITDSHSAFLTSILWVVSRFWHSPSVIPVLQLLALTGVTILIIAKMHEFGVSRFICFLGSILFPLFPANFLMVTTIWKDVPYTIGMLFIFWLLLTLIQTNGKSAKSISWRRYFIAALFLVAFTRHNGLLVAVALPVTCLICYRKVADRFFIFSTAGIFLIVLFVKSILFPLLHVPFLPKHYQPIAAIHVLGAQLVTGVPFTKEEESLLQSVHSLDRWKSLYNCQTYGPLFFGDGQGSPSYEALASHSGELIKLALIKTLDNPGIYIRHQACATSMLWRIIPFQGEVLHTTPLGVWKDPLTKQYGLLSAPKLNKLNKILIWLSEWTKNDKRVWLFWRPGFWLLLSVVSCTGLSLAMRNARLLLLLAPSLLNTLSFFFLIGSPDFRYQWAVVVLGMFLVPLALFRRALSNNEREPTSLRIMWKAAGDLSLSASPITMKENAVLQLSSADHSLIAVVIPCYRVREHILPLLARIGPECSLIYCVDDKCPQQSGSFIQEHTNDPRVRVLFHQENQGVGGAVMTGYQAAIRDGATVMVKLDGDGQMDPSLLPAFVTPIIEGTADYTKGNRFFHVEGVREMPPLRLFGNAVLSFLTKISSGYWSTFDPTNGYTAIHSSVARSLPFSKIDRRYFFESDMLFRLNVLRARIVDIPMSAVYRGEKSSMVISSIAGEFLWKHLRNFAKRIGYNYFLRDFSIASLELLLGIPLLTFGFFFGLHTWISSFETGVVSTAGTVMLSVLPSILGVQFLLSFVSHDILRTPSEPIQQMLQRLPATYFNMLSLEKPKIDSSGSNRDPAS